MHQRRQGPRDLHHRRGELARPAALLALGAVCDIADGWLARRLGVVSEFGARLDWHADVAVGTSVLAATGLAWAIPLLVAVQSHCLGRVRVSGRSAAPAWTHRP